jgi:hypothetical protein
LALRPGLSIRDHLPDVKEMVSPAARCSRCGRRSVMKTQYDEKKSAHGEVC